MKIALAQIDILSGQTDRNIKKICHYIDRAKCELGAGLIIFPEMIDPQRVIGFLDITGDWDATLLFVMGGALMVSLPCFQIALKHRPVCAEQFDLPAKTAIDRPLLIGAILFGIGWGLAGLCPGPAIAGMATLSYEIIGFVLAMIVGQLCVGCFIKYKK